MSHFHLCALGPESRRLRSFAVLETAKNITMVPNKIPMSVTIKVVALS